MHILSSTDISDCYVGACLNGGTCVDHVNTYTCQCPSGRSGLACEIGTNNLSNVIWHVVWTRLKIDMRLHLKAFEKCAIRKIRYYWEIIYSTTFLQNILLRNDMETGGAVKCRTGPRPFYLQQRGWPIIRSFLFHLNYMISSERHVMKTILHVFRSIRW